MGKIVILPVLKAFAWTQLFCLGVQLDIHFSPLVVKNNSHPCHFWHEGKPVSYCRPSGNYSEGSKPEWCICTIYHAWDTPFWSGTLNFFLSCHALYMPLFAFINEVCFFSYDRNPGYRLLEVQLVLCWCVWWGARWVKASIFLMIWAGWYCYRD